MVRFIVISGCSGGGKSSLVAQFARHGHDVVEEPGRRIVAQELAGEGSALPWHDPVAFARRAIEVALADLDEAQSKSGVVFFDRGLIDAVAALKHCSEEPLPALPVLEQVYDKDVFLAPPWPEIRFTDSNRRHGLEEAIEEYKRLEAFFPSLGYRTHILPKTDIQTRVEFVLDVLV